METRRPSRRRHRGHESLERSYEGWKQKHSAIAFSSHLKSLERSYEGWKQNGSPVAKRSEKV